MFLPPRLIQAVGIAIVVFGVVFWAVTARESYLIMAAGMSLVGMSWFSKVRISIEDRPEKEGESWDPPHP